MKAVILAGGEGTRLRPLTLALPKVMFPVINIPFLEHMVLYLKCHEIREIVLALGFMPQTIENYFGDGSRWGVRVSYGLEKAPLGTAGAVKNVSSLLTETFLVFNGDIFTDLDLQAMIACHREKKARGTIALTPMEDPSRFGVVETDLQGRVLAFKEKPHPEAIVSRNINAGVYVLEPEVLDYIPAGHFMFERGLFPLLLERREALWGYPFSGYWVDMGTPEHYLKLNYDLLQSRGGNRFQGCHIHPTARVEGPVILGKGSSLGPRARVKGPAVLGEGCQIEGEVLIEGSVLWQGVEVGEGTTLKNSIVASHCHIGRGCWLDDGCILGEGVNLGEGNRLGRGDRVEAEKQLEPGSVSP